MADLTERHLDNLLSGYSGATGTDDVPSMIAEIRRHRAAMRRLERVAVNMAGCDELFGDWVASEIRAATKVDANG